MNPNFTIRRCVPSDAAALSLVAAATFLESYAELLPGEDIVAHCGGEHSAERYGALLGDPEVQIWVAEVTPGRAPVGYLVAGPSTLEVADRSPGDSEIRRIYVLHPVQGAGLGRGLLDVASCDARDRGATRVLLGVFGENAGARAFYAHMGFSEVGTRRFRVGGNHYDDLILARDL